MNIVIKLFKKLFYKEHHFPKNPYNPHCWIIGNPQIARECWIGPFTVIDASGGLDIGEGTNISNRDYPELDKKPVKIGKYCHIGPNSTILMGTKIGDYSVIGTGTVVLENTEIPPYSVVVGIPAKITGKDSRQLLEE